MQMIRLGFFCLHNQRRNHKLMAETHQDECQGKGACQGFASSYEFVATIGSHCETIVLIRLPSFLMNNWGF